MEYKINATVYFDVQDNEDPEEIADKVENWIQSLIDRHMNNEPKAPTNVSIQYYDIEKNH